MSDHVSPISLYLTIFFALMVQWARASAREARRIDRALDRAEAAAAGE